MWDENNLYGYATGLDERGRFDTFSAAVASAFKDLTATHDPFFDALVDSWPTLFPGLKARPGRYEENTLYLYVPSAALLYATRPRLRAITAKLKGLPQAPKKLEVRLEAHAR